jgi:hypothetical protein
MSIDAGTIEQERVAGSRHVLGRVLGRVLGHVPAWAWLGIWVYALLLINGSILLNDSDTYWHIAVGKWILEHNALPHADIYSFTKTGEPWISSSWLAQVLYAGSYELAGWAGPVILSVACVAVTFAMLASMLGRRIPSTWAILISLAALVLSVTHLFARPHLLALPVMVIWAYGLMSASERHQAPSLSLLPLMALWANLHGGFVFGLVLVAGIAFDAWWNAPAPQRMSLAARWIVFGFGAIAACCVTPYGWGSILASRKILDLGELLHLIYEWMPADFSRFGPFEACVLALTGGALYCGVRLSPPRIALVLGLLHMALSHVRNIEVFALLLPLVVLTPLASQFMLRPARFARMDFPVVSVMALLGIVGASTWAFAANTRFSPPAIQSPAAAVDALKERNSKRVLNDLPFGGYLISRGVPVFIDGRAELYGEAFEIAYYRAMQLKDVNVLLDLLKRYDIDAVLLTPATPAVTMLDHRDGWRRVYVDETAVLHIRTVH